MGWPEGGWLAGILGALYVAAAVVAVVHVILFKRDTRAAVAWVGLIVLVPVGGALLYLAFGINRIRRRATELRGQMPRVTHGDAVMPFTPSEQSRFLSPAMVSLARLVDRVTQEPLLEGNRITPLRNGDQAYPRMLEAIRNARTSVSLSTYIFSNDATGREFVQALGDAVSRGVNVRLLVDAVGLRYSLPSIIRHLRRAHVPFARFMPSRTPLAVPFLNLRNHRKMLVVDGVLGFTGGMNIAEGNRVARQPTKPIRDVHFEIEGPTVTELQRVFAQDWVFASGEVLRGNTWFPPLYAPGSSLARVIVDGPDERYDTLRQVLVGALSIARHRVRIMTPYFLPDATLQDALQTAALRGVEVDVLLPGRNNLPVIDWAGQMQLEELVRWDVRVWHGRDFDHSKLFTVDGEWSLIGSANWDPRSLLLNFECNVESYDRTLAATLDDWFDLRLSESRPVTLEGLRQQGLAKRLRNGVARLLSPYL